MTMNETDVRAAVERVLTLSGLPATDEERGRLERSYLTMREMAASLRVPETRYGEPALVYPATLTR